MTTGQIEDLIEKHWAQDALSLYFAQVLSGEETIESTLEDLMSFEKKRLK